MIGFSRRRWVPLTLEQIDPSVVGWFRELNTTGANAAIAVPLPTGTQINDTLVALHGISGVFVDPDLPVGGNGQSFTNIYIFPRVSSTVGENLRWRSSYKKVTQADLTLGSINLMCGGSHEAALIALRNVGNPTMGVTKSQGGGVASMTMDNITPEQKSLILSVFAIAQTGRGVSFNNGWSIAKTKPADETSAFLGPGRYYAAAKVVPSNTASLSVTASFSPAGSQQAQNLPLIFGTA